MVIVLVNNHDHLLARKLTKPLSYQASLISTARIVPVMDVERFLQQSLESFSHSTDAVLSLGAG